MRLFLLHWAVVLWSSPVTEHCPRGVC